MTMRSLLNISPLDCQANILNEMVPVVFEGKLNLDESLFLLSIVSKFVSKPLDATPLDSAGYF